MASYRLGDDVFRERVIDIAREPFELEFKRISIPKHIEKKWRNSAANSMGAAFLNLYKNADNSGEFNSYVGMPNLVRQAFSNTQLTHAQYYNDTWVISRIARTISDAE